MLNQITELLFSKEASNFQLALQLLSGMEEEVLLDLLPKICNAAYVRYRESGEFILNGIARVIGSSKCLLLYPHDDALLYIFESGVLHLRFRSDIDGNFITEYHNPNNKLDTKTASYIVRKFVSLC